MSLSQPNLPRALDGYVLEFDDPRYTAHQRINQLLAEAFEPIQSWEDWSGYRPPENEAWRAIAELPPHSRALVWESLICRLRTLEPRIEELRSFSFGRAGDDTTKDLKLNKLWAIRMYLLDCLSKLFDPELPFSTDYGLELIRFCTDSKSAYSGWHPYSEALETAKVLLSRPNVSITNDIDLLINVVTVQRTTAKKYRKQLSELERLMNELSSSARNNRETGSSKFQKESLSAPEVTKETRAKSQAMLQQAEEEAVHQKAWYLEEFLATQAGGEIIRAPAEEQRAVVLITIDQIRQVGARLGEFNNQTYRKFWNLTREKGYPKAGAIISRELLKRKLPFSEQEIVLMLENLGKVSYLSTFAVPLMDTFVTALERWVKSNGPSPSIVLGLQLTSESLGNSGRACDKRLKNKLQDLAALCSSSEAASSEMRLPLRPGEAWSDAALSDISSASSNLRQKWADLLVHCSSAKSASPTSLWVKNARCLVRALGNKQFSDRVRKWFELVDLPRTTPMERDSEYHPDPNELILDPHMDILRGLAWCSSFKEDKAMARALSDLARSAYRKVPLIGPRAVRVGNAAVTALGRMPGFEGVYQLAFLKVKVKFGTAQKVIDKAFNTAAKRAGLPREEIEELAVPGYGLTSVGLAEERFGEFTARLLVTATTSTDLAWVKEDGKIQKGVPASVKANFAEDLKDLKAAAKDIERMLPAQRERIDTMFLQQKVWPTSVWRERYLDHPLVGVLARRLLWEFKHENSSRTGIWFRDKIVDLDLREISMAQDSLVQLWHPIGKDLDDIVAWRDWLDTQQIQQPFKQAHREVYLLTDAERGTSTYSNRYAAHVLKQHQFNALCALRGWKNKLRLMVDDEYPPATLNLPNWGLRAEYWIEGAGEDDATDINESGVFLRVVTDQVRFYRTESSQGTSHAFGGGYHPAGGEHDPGPVPLDEIPPLVFSEVMRDIDMFIGVASLGNDPAWSDGGPGGRYQNYWGEFSFGELSGSARTRKDVLQLLVPRLKIASQCSFEDRFLVVKGKRRTYKIHLGSGNILMSPNDQYLCIVPKQSIAEDGKVLLPFEGDRTLSVILSKAFLLAADDKIQDPSIVAQIAR